MSTHSKADQVMDMLKDMGYGVQREEFLAPVTSIGDLGWGTSNKYYRVSFNVLGHTVGHSVTEREIELSLLPEKDFAMAIVRIINNRLKRDTYEH